MKTLKSKTLSRITIFTIILGLLLFVPAWTISYWQGWIYFLVVSICLFIMTLYFLKHDPALMESRIKIGPKAEKKISQKIFLSFFVILIIGLVLFSALDQSDFTKGNSWCCHNHLKLDDINWLLYICTLFSERTVLHLLR